MKKKIELLKRIKRTNLVICFAVVAIISVSSWVFAEYLDSHNSILVDDTTGCVYIGEQSVPKNLDVNGNLTVKANRSAEAGLSVSNESTDSAAHTRFVMKAVTGAQNIIRFLNGSDCKWKFYHNTNDDKFIFQYYPSSDRVNNLVLLPTGGVEINGGVNSSGTVKAVNYACSSDQRFKENIAPLNNALAKVFQLNGVSYNWKKDYKGKTFDGSKDLGFIAQDVEKIYPELVYTDKEGYKSMNYQKLTAVIVEAMKEMKVKSDAKMAALEKENKALKLKVASLEKLNNRISKLERILDKAEAVALK